MNKALIYVACAAVFVCHSSYAIKEIDGVGTYLAQARQSSAYGSIRDLLETMIELNGVMVFPTAPPSAENSESAFYAYKKYTLHACDELIKFLEVLTREVDSFGDRKLKLLVSSMRGSMESQAVSARDVTKQFSWSNSYARDVRDGGLRQLQVLNASLVQKLTDFASKYAEGPSERDVALEAIRANPELYAQGLQHQILAAELDLTAKQANVAAAVAGFEAQVEAARAGSGERIAAIEQEIAQAQAAASVELNQALDLLKRKKNELGDVQVQIMGLGQTLLDEGEELTRMLRAQDSTRAATAEITTAVQDLFEAQASGQQDVDVVVPPGSPLAKWLDLYQKVLQSELLDKINSKRLEAFNVESGLLSPNVRIQVRLFHPKSVRTNWFALWTIGFKATLDVKAEIWLGPKNRRTTITTIPVRFVKGQFDQRSKDGIGTLLTGQIFPAIQSVAEAAKQTDLVKEAVDECLATLAGLR